MAGELTATAIAGQALRLPPSRDRPQRQAERLPYNHARPDRPHRFDKLNSAFSLVEVLVAIFIAMLIVGIAVMSIGAVNEEARIRRVGAVLEATARTSLQHSVQRQRDHWVDFSADGFVAGPDGKAYRLPDGGRIELRHWGESRWTTPAGSSDEPWRFSRQGLCEPLQVRVTLGSATLEMQFDPLTGAVAEESLIVEEG